MSKNARVQRTKKFVPLRYLPPTVFSVKNSSDTGRQVSEALACFLNPPACVSVYRKKVLRDSRFGSSLAWANPWERLHGQYLFLIQADNFQ